MSLFSFLDLFKLSNLGSLSILPFLICEPNPVRLVIVELNHMAMISNLNDSSFRETSFASYLRNNNNIEEKLVAVKLSEPNNKIRSLDDDQHHDYLRRTKQEEDDGEIGVFGAEKYFNGRIDEEAPAPPNPRSLDSPRKFCSAESEEVGFHNVKPKLSRAGTPSVGSKSSWNSQSALLRSITRDPSQRKTNKDPVKKSFIPGICCKCSCSGGNSIEVGEQIGEISFKTSADLKKAASAKKKPISDPWIKENPFSFPIVYSGRGIKIPPVKVPLQEEEEEEEANQLPRKSLKVFGSPILGKGSSNFLTVEKTTSWDTESNASSDLFELESITGKENPFLATQSFPPDAPGCISPPHCYAPSEASIEWSVVTASVADYSVMSDSEDLRSAVVTTATSPLRTFYHASNGKTGNNIEMQRGRSRSILGCKSQKSVTVAGGDVYRTTAKAKLEPDQYMAGATRFRAETKHVGFDQSRTRQQGLGTGSFSQSYTPRASAPQLLLI